MRALHLAVPFATVVSLMAQEPPPQPQTVPEATHYAHTSRVDDVRKFIDAVLKLPKAERIHVEIAGKSHEGRELLHVKVALPEPGKDRLRVLVIGNIHAGEIEGKESIQLLLREFASGEHEELLRAAELHFVPIYNPDGNERIDVKNRVEQNGPDGVGERANGNGLDLNRDFVKAEAEETRILLSLFRSIDPQLFMDLHTTNGSYHGYHLTYAPSLCVSIDPGIARLSRTLLDDATAAMAAQKFQVFDYGNFETRDWDGSGAPESKGQKGWWSYDQRPRYGTNYFGLRNRIAVLSEAYSYCDFQSRIAATRAFVLAVVAALCKRADEVRAACALADRRLTAPDAPVYLGTGAIFAEPEQLPVLVGAVDKQEIAGLGTRLIRKGDGTPEPMPVFRRFRAQQTIALPVAWALLAPSAAVVDLLAAHGVHTERLAVTTKASAQQFAVTAKRKPKRPYQGHQELELQGQWADATAVELPAGTVLVSARQPLGRLAAQLLEPQSDDSLSTWNCFEAATGDSYPVLRCAAEVVR